MSIRKPLIGFSLFMVGALLLTWVFFTTLMRSVDGDTKTYTATFADVLGLTNRADVRIAGVRVGRVEKIEIDDDNNARVTFVVQSDQQLDSNTKGLIRYQNLIGQRYLALMPGQQSGAPLTDGGDIPMYVPGSNPKVRQTEDSFDVSKLLGGFEPLFGALQPDQINALSESLILALQGDNVSLSTFITQAAGVAATLSERDAILGDVVHNLSGVLAGLANRSGELETLVAQTRTLVNGFYAQGEVLKTSTVAVANASDDIVRLLGNIEPQLVTAQTSTTSALAHLVNNGALLDQTAVDFPRLTASVARVTTMGAYIPTGVCTLDVSLWGVLFPPGVFEGVSNQIFGTKHSEACR